MFTAVSRPRAFARASRLAHPSGARFESNVLLRKGAEEETRSGLAINKLSEAIRNASNPESRSLMPIRSKGLWRDLQNKFADEASSSASDQSLRSAQSSKLKPRRMADSFVELELPFESDPHLLERYVNRTGLIQTGRLLEDLDALAGSVAYKHLLPNSYASADADRTRDFYFVTASVDRLDMIKPLTTIRDVRLSGHVSFCGKSSLEVFVKMEGLPPKGTEKPSETLMLGRFSMVCRDSRTGGPREINPLVLETPEEMALHRLGQENKERRSLDRKASLDRVPPSKEEARALHQLYLDKHPNDTLLGDRSVWMSDTKTSSLYLIHPQDRNVHGKAFGGHLMRIAYELGYSSALLFSRRPQLRFQSSDEIAFKLPVPIGCVLRLSSQVVHTGSSSGEVQVSVRADVVDVESGEEKTTNEFVFSWSADGEGYCIVPRTYEESMAWLKGKRRRDVGSEIRRLWASATAQ